MAKCPGSNINPEKKDDDKIIIIIIIITTTTTIITAGNPQYLKVKDID